ncbi:MAG: copper chaperone PCu(A)C [Rubrivivax sp.]
MPHRSFRLALSLSLCCALGALSATAARAQSVVVADPWVRGTVAQQKASGFFARLTAPAGAKLVGVSSPAAGLAEIHEMAMEGSTMRMRPLAAGLELPAGQTVELKPGGLHVMLMDLRQTPLAAGQTVPLTLLIEKPDGTRESVTVQAPVRPLGAMPPASMPGHGKH